MIARRTEIKFTFRLTFWISNFSHSAPRHDPRRVNFIRGWARFHRGEKFYCVRETIKNRFENRIENFSPPPSLLRANFKHVAPWNVFSNSFELRTREGPLLPPHPHPLNFRVSRPACFVLLFTGLQREITLKILCCTKGGEGRGREEDEFHKFYWLMRFSGSCATIRSNFLLVFVRATGLIRTSFAGS